MDGLTVVGPRFGTGNGGPMRITRVNGIDFEATLHGGYDGSIETYLKQTNPNGRRC